jgi:hypothetical protein
MPLVSLGPAGPGPGHAPASTLVTPTSSVSVEMPGGGMRHRKPSIGGVDEIGPGDETDALYSRGPASHTIAYDPDNEMPPEDKRQQCVLG